MVDLAQIVAARLSEAFGNDTQEITARKVNTVQSNVSKWVKGQQIPQVDNLLEISKAYGVSIDWILGVSDKKEIDDVSIEKLTYEQAARIIDYLIKLGSIEVPNVNDIAGHGSNDINNDYSDLDDICVEEDETSEEKVTAKPQPIYDSDLLKINDRILSHILRRRLKMYEIGDDYADLWRENTLPVFKGVRVVVNSENLRNAIDTKNWPTFNDGDWVSTIEELSKLTEEELRALAQAAINKEKEGKDDGR